MTKGEGQETVSCLLEIVLIRQHDFDKRGEGQKMVPRSHGAEGGEMKGNRMRFWRQRKSCQKNRPRDTFFILFTILCIVMMPLSAFSVRAEEQEYSVPSADFEVEIRNDGTVHVTENWEVFYKKGFFTRFYKDIYRTVPKEEEFDLDESSMKVSIDGKDCTPVDNTTDREDYTFHLQESSTAYTVHCFLASKHVTRKYQISYTIRDAVKIVDGEYYLVTFRMIGANFPKSSILTRSRPKGTL